MGARSAPSLLRRNPPFSGPTSKRRIPPGLVHRASPERRRDRCVACLVQTARPRRRTKESDRGGRCCQPRQRRVRGAAPAVSLLLCRRVSSRGPAASAARRGSPGSPPATSRVNRTNTRNGRCCWENAGQSNLRLGLRRGAGRERSRSQGAPSSARGDPLSDPAARSSWAGRSPATTLATAFIASGHSWPSSLFAGKKCAASNFPRSRYRHWY